MPATREACLVLVAGLCLGGCGDGGGEPGLGQLRIVSGLAQADTTGVVLEEPLVVEVHGQGGSPAEGVTVRFGPAGCLPACALPFSTDLGRVVPELEVATDARGRASTRVYLSYPAGEAGVPIEVQSLDLADTARFHIEPGNPVGVLIHVSDTCGVCRRQLRAAGGAGRPVAEPASRGGQLRLRTPTVARSGQRHSEGRGNRPRHRDGKGRRVHGGGPGQRGPEGTVALGEFAVPSHIYVVNLDGTGRRLLAETGALYGGASTWDPDGQTIVYHFSENLGDPLAPHSIQRRGLSPAADGCVAVGSRPFTALEAGGSSGVSEAPTSFPRHHRTAPG